MLLVKRKKDFNGCPYMTFRRSFGAGDHERAEAYASYGPKNLSPLK